MEEYLIKLAEQNATHIAVLNHEYGVVCERLAVVETKVGTIEQLMWVIVIAVVGASVAQYFSHIAIKREIKNGKK